METDLVTSARSWVLSHFVPFEMEIDRGETEVSTMRSAFWTSLRYANQAAGRLVLLASVAVVSDVVYCIDHPVDIIY